MTFRFKIIAIFTLLIIGFAPNAASAQTQLKYKINQTVDIAADDSAKVTYKVSVSGDPGTELDFAISAVELSDLVVKINGNSTESTYQLAAEEQLLPYSVARFAVPEAIKGNWNFTLSYQTNSIVQRADKGGTSVIVTAPERKATVTSEQLTVTMPLGSMLPVAFAVEPNRSTVDGEQQQYQYNFNGPRSSAVVLEFGQIQTNRYKFEATLKNTSWWWQTKRVALPPDTTLQQSVLDSIQPAPGNVRLDKHGNMFVEYRLAPRSSLTVEAELVIRTTSAKYDFAAASTIVDSNQYQDLLDVAGRYDSGQAKSDDAIVQLVKSLFDQAMTQKQSTVELVASARASGVPAREVHGWIAAFDETGPVAHDWAEVLIPDVGWVVLDPELATEFASFSRSSNWRIRSTIIANQNQYDDLIPAEPATLSRVESDVELPSFEPGQIQLRSTNYVLLPGVSLRRDVVTLPTGVAQDDVALKSASGGLQRLGSLAPLQQIVRSNFVFLGDSIASTQQQVGRIEGDEFVSITDTTTTTNWLPLVGLAALVAMGVGGRWLYRRRGGSKQHINLNQPDEIDVREPEQLLESEPDYEQ